VKKKQSFLDKMRERILKKKVVVFDLDGTLLDSMGIFADIASFLIAWKHKIPRKDAKQMYINTSGIPFFQQLEVLFPGHAGNKEISRMFEEKKVHATEHLEMDTEEADALRKLSEKKYKLAISSNNFQENVGRFHEFTDLDFDYVLGYKDGFSKGKDHFDFILEREGITKDEVIFVGDSLSDMKKAREYGIDFIAKTGTFSDKDFERENPNVITIRHLRELLDILQ
jgi:phosphoglycolate phosphatase